MRVPKFRLFLVLLLGAGVVAGWMSVVPVPLKNIFGGNGERVSDTSIVDEYRAKFALDEQGDLRSTEVIAVEFTEVRRGIFRIFDTRDAQYPSVQHPVEVESVERKEDGQWIPEPYIVSQEGGGTKTIRIGNAGRPFPPGIQTYRIISTTPNALTKPKGGPDGASSQWYWDVLGSGWAMPMRKVRISATIPEPIAPPSCEAAIPCEITLADGAYSIAADNVAPYTPITMKAFFAVPAPAVQRTSGQNALLLATLAFVGLSLLLTISAFVRSRERKPQIAPTFEPPGPDPLLCAWTLDETPVGRGVPTVLLNLVAHKVVDFAAEQPSVADNNGPDWIKLTRTATASPDLVGFGTALHDLGLYQQGHSRMLSKDSVTDGRLLQELEGEITGQTQEAISRSGLAATVRGSGLALLLIYLALIGGFTALIWFDTGLLVATLLLVAAVMGLIINRRDTTRLTDLGCSIRDRTAGFKQVLSTNASIERFDYAARVRHFDEYLPWAVAFDCADEWAASCTPPPGSPEAASMGGMSGYYSSPVRNSPMWAMSTGIVAVEASAVAAYQATQRSSSSSGGGGGGGGGGGSGGGGGGSW
jgi:uncharacterized membrane protein YgcG